MKVNAAVIRNPGDRYVFETVNMVDEPGKGEVMVKIYASSVCHSDEAVRSKGICIQLPAILGHEGVGIVEKIGEGVTAVKPGDHVILTVPHCGKCEACQKEEYLSCPETYPMYFKTASGIPHFTTESGEVLGQMMAQGSFAEYTVVYESSCVKIDNDIPFDIAAPIGCGFSTGTGTVLNYLKPTPEDSIAVYGVGSTGSAAIMGAKLAGCKTIIAVSRSDEKLELAKKLGATHLINRSKIEAEQGAKVALTGPAADVTPFVYPVTEAVRAVTGGKGVNYAVVTAPTWDVAYPAILSLANRGECCVTSSFGDYEIPAQWMQSTSTKVSSCAMGLAQKYKFFPYLLEQWKKGNYPVDLLITHYKFNELNEAFSDMEEGKVIKPVLEW